MSDTSVIGKIHSVYCKNFVTYVEVRVYCGEFLNVIIGPNGSGKSTLVAAIVLGLGGNPKLLSRSSSVEEYIKNGQAEANIEIDIYKNSQKETITFGRAFNSTGKSTYSVDKSTVSHKNYLAAIQNFNIQINNLCQFLPQDRVQDFAKMNPNEILINTMTSVCSQEVVKNFEMLKEFQNQQKNSYKGLKDSLDKLKELENQNAQLKEQIDRMNIRKKLQKDISIYESKKVWLEYMELEKNVQNTELELKQANTILKKHRDNFEKAKKKSQDIIRQKESMSTLTKNEENKLRQISSELDQLQNTSEQYETTITNLKSSFERKKSEIIEREKDLKTETLLLTAHATDLKSALNDLGPVEERNIKTAECERRIMQLKSEHKSLMEAHRNINRELDEQYTPELKVVKRKIASLENIGDRKLTNLRDNYEHIYEATNWLRQNRDIFEAQVYEPMVLELNINDSNNAKYIENIVNARDLLAFTCESKSDMNKLVQHLCNEKGLKVSVVHCDAAEHCLYRPDKNIEEYRALGFTSYLIDMLSGPAPILNYLCREYGIHTILAGTEEVNNHTHEIPNQIRIYFAGNDKITTMYSKYTKEKSTMRTSINDRKLLSVGVDEKEINSLKKKYREITKKSDELKNRRAEIETKLNMIEENRKEIINEKNILDKKLVVIEQLKEKIKNQKAKIERLQSRPSDLQEVEKNFKDSARESVRKLLQLEQKKIGILNNYQETSEKYNMNYTKLQIYKNETSNVEQKIADLKESFDNSYQLVETIKTTFEKLQEQSKKIEKSVRERCKGKIPTETGFPFTPVFSQISNDLSELTDKILEMQSKVNCMLAENQNIYDEYQEREDEIKQLRSEIESNTKSASQILHKMQEIHEEWFPIIMGVIETINSNFGNFMSSMNYVGEVQLFRKDDHDYESYGIQILVKYRNEAKLQALDRFVQSGGERAVAIAVYTLSLQRITHVPFRCVDEINQGMDANNERKVFDMLVEETSQPGHSQYFFITPKLLQNLSYNEYMTIHIVYNGPFIANDEVFLNF
ncbi:structural maintenance of chromosomes protein 5 [Condylostylus longicornis]|uniref:structural maintenance of chromosomes protein 5 n=1 Tax=Condylostylus longicornis TaxID=2530218 RepID=UPI00244DC606|nr:structural maintenance of chromosomes protein 5 [Condylostylus longicornis]